MKSSQLNTSEPPPATSASSSRDNPCLGNDPKVAALDVYADNGISYLLPYAQFLYAERTANPALEQEPDAPPEKMRICFVQAEIVVLGSGLKTLAKGIQNSELKFVKSADRRLAATLNAHIAAVTVALSKENV
jgi:hypothetical protein